MELESIVWDGTSLSTIVAIGNRRVTCFIPRETVHALSVYGDAVGWEIDRHKLDIFERLKATLQHKLQGGSAQSRFQLAPSDLI
jgi:hypothetical protein